MNDNMIIVGQTNILRGDLIKVETLCFELGDSSITIDGMLVNANGILIGVSTPDDLNTSHLTYIVPLYSLSILSVDIADRMIKGKHTLGDIITYLYMSYKVNR